MRKISPYTFMPNLKHEPIQSSVKSSGDEYIYRFDASWKKTLTPKNFTEPNPGRLIEVHSTSKILIMTHVFQYTNIINKIFICHNT